MSIEFPSETQWVAMYQSYLASYCWYRLKKDIGNHALQGIADAATQAVAMDDIARGRRPRTMKNFRKTVSRMLFGRRGAVVAGVLGS